MGWKAAGSNLSADQEFLGHNFSFKDHLTHFYFTVYKSFGHVRDVISSQYIKRPNRVRVVALFLSKETKKQSNFSLARELPMNFKEMCASVSACVSACGSRYRLYVYMV